MSADNHIRIRNLSDDDDTARRGGQQQFPPRPSPRNAIIDARAGEGAARKLDDGGKEGCVRIVPTYLLTGLAITCMPTTFERETVYLIWQLFCRGSSDDPLVSLTDRVLVITPGMSQQRQRHTKPAGWHGPKNLFGAISCCL